MGIISVFEEVAVSLILDDWEKKCDAQNRYFLEWERNSCVRYGRKRHGLVDLKVMLCNRRTRTLSRTYYYEMKSCRSDLNSGNGINFDGDCNYIVYPRNCKLYVVAGSQLNFGYLEKWLSKRKYDHVGIICVEADNTLTIERTARKKDAIPMRLVCHGTFL